MCPCFFLLVLFFVFFKQKTAYEMRISDWSSDVCSSDLFTPTRELPFAGHPTVGTAVALAELQRGDEGDVDLVCVLEEQVGPVRCAVRLRAGVAGFAEFDLPQMPACIVLPLDVAGLADALNIVAGGIRFDNHRAADRSAEERRAGTAVARTCSSCGSPNNSETKN